MKKFLKQLAKILIILIIIALIVVGVGLYLGWFQLSAMVIAPTAIFGGLTVKGLIIALVGLGVIAAIMSPSGASAALSQVSSATRAVAKGSAQVVSAAMAGAAGGFVDGLFGGSGNFVAILIGGGLLVGLAYLLLSSDDDGYDDDADLVPRDQDTSDRSVPSQSEAHVTTAVSSQQTAPATNAPIVEARPVYQRVVEVQ